ncbi:hypothetical protein BJ684DRAFT_9356 [Piptocephalis cylindrospora]|uniref:Protoporphyrinogen oxidase n=1 Tax=Piptocephalis cylindrospora TaxID=1907219 RepID=A0A4P9Y4V6_9FUNG|nr:hypothetical protein BJ684DRAFT_9356 [Piptocephalis cylindrospora]|eukprot:RKP13933.1 hypothetical protein BJ684DRAFT_9356 [Piptocephalis cylindrospora]
MHIAILGAGITGLTLARTLSLGLVGRGGGPIRISVLEGQGRVGGWVQTQRKSVAGEDAVFEQGPRTLRPSGPAGLRTLRLLGDLGLAEDVVQVGKGAPAARKRYLYVQGRLLRLPASILDTVKASASGPLKGLVGSVLREPFIPGRPRDLEDESVQDFFARRFPGADGIQLAASAMMHGIYAGDYRKLSVRSCLPSLWEAEGRSGSLVRGMLLSGSKATTEEDEARHALKIHYPQLMEMAETSAIYSLRQGLSGITDALNQVAIQSPIVTMRPSSPVTKVILDESKAKVMDADWVVSTLPGPSIASCMKGSPGNPIPYTTPYASVAVVNMAFSQRVLPLDPAFGYLVPVREGGDALGVVFDSDALPSQDGARQGGLNRLTVMMGGWKFKQIFGEKPHPDDVLKKARRVLKEQMGIVKEPMAHHVSIQCQCIPQYEVGWWDGMRQVDEWLRSSTGAQGRMAVCGAGWGGVSVNDCVQGAEKVGHALLDHLKGKTFSGASPTLPLTGLERFRK